MDFDKMIRNNWNKINVKSAWLNLIIAVLIPCATTLWGSFWGRYGIDITDTGFFLQLQQQLAYKGEVELTSQILWLGSDLLGYAWLILSDHNLVHARVGSHFMTGLITGVLFLLSVKITESRLASLILILVTYAIFWLFTGFQIINYGLAPLLPLVFLIAIQVAIKTNNYIKFFLTGFMLSLIVFTRIPLILFSIVALIIISFQYFESKNTKNESFVNGGHNKIFLGVSLVAGGALLIIFLWIFPITNNLIILMADTFAPKIDRSYALLHFNTGFEELNGYGLKDQMFRWIIGGLVMSVFCLTYIAFGVIANKLKKIAATCLVCMLLIIPILSNELFAFKSSEFSQIVFKAISYLYSLTYFAPALTIFCSIYILYKYQDSLFVDEKTLLRLIIALTILFPVGSNSYEKQMVLTSPLTIPILISIIYSLIKRNYAAVKFTQIKPVKIIIFSFACFVPGIFWLRVADAAPFMEANYKFLQYKINYPVLSGIVTTESKAEILNSILPIASKHCGNKTLLTNGKANMFNYVLNSKMVFPVYDPLGTYPKYFKTVLAKGELPDCILISDLDFTRSNWPVKDMLFYSHQNESQLENLKLINSIIKSEKYKLIADQNNIYIYTRKSED